MVKPINADNRDYYSNSLSNSAPVNSESVQPRPALTEDLTITSAKAIGAVKPSTPQPQNYQLLIKFKPGTSPFQQQAITSEMAMKNLQKFSNIPNLVTVTVRSSQPIDSVLAQLKKNTNVEFIELNKEFKLPDLQPPVSYTADQIRAERAKFPGSDFSIPNDTNFAQQWDKQSQGDGPASSGSINAQSAWKVTTGSQDVVVAVLDTGIDYNHPDLANNIWTGEDGSHGYNAVGNNNDPLDDNSHGTQVAGIIGAVGNNRQGVAGVNWNVKMMPIKIANARGSNQTYDVLEAIDYVLTQKKNGVNIKVLNNSWGGDPESPALREAIKELDKVGILFVAAAGNSSVNNDEQPSYPASYDLPNVITVAATDRDGNLADFSNYGSHTVHIAAPGMGDRSFLEISSEKWVHS